MTDSDSSNISDNIFIADKADLDGFYREREDIVNAVIPDGVTSVGIYVLSKCGSPESITSHDSMASIGKYAFCGCGISESITMRGQRYTDRAAFNKAVKSSGVSEGEV